MTEHPSFKWLPPGEPIPGKTYRADGWQYVDLSTRLSFDMKNYFLGIVGDGEYVILAQTTMPDSWRGQILISPEGQRRMREHALGRQN